MIPVSVRLSNSRVDQHITSQIGDLSYRSVMPGGFALANFTLHRPISTDDPLLTPFTRVYIYDHDGTTLWEGRLQLPGKTAGDQAEVWSLSALGPSAHAQDRTVPLIYLDRDQTHWTPMPGSRAGARTGVDTDPYGTEVLALRCQFPQGLTIPVDAVAGLTYDAIHDAGLTLGAFGWSFNSGASDTNYTFQAVTGSAGDRSQETPDSDFMGGSAVTVRTNFVITDFPAGRTYLGMWLLRNGFGGATTVPNDNAWVQAWHVRVLMRRMDKTGSLVSAAGMASSARVRASEVVEDLLGRLLTQYDGANATVEATTFDIDQLAYVDGVTPAKVLEDLMALEAGYTWAAWESGSTGKYRFEWKARPTTVRYEATVDDGFESPAPSFDQYDSVVVRWRDVNGQLKTTRRTQVVDELVDAGVTREAYIDLADEAGSLTNATKAGDDFLAEHRYPPNGGTLTIARPVLDLSEGAFVAPQKVRPGELIRVRGIEGSVDSLNASERDGAVVFWVVAVDVAGDGTATLELDTFTRTQERALVELTRTGSRRR